MEAANSGKCDDFACAWRFDSTSVRRIALERRMRAIFVVVGDMLADQAEQMTLPEHNHMIEQLAA